MSILIEVLKYHGVILLLASLLSLLVVCYLVDRETTSGDDKSKEGSTTKEGYTFKKFLLHFSCLVVCFHFLLLSLDYLCRVTEVPKQSTYSSTSYYLDLESLEEVYSYGSKDTLEQFMLGSNPRRLKIKNKETDKKSSLEDVKLKSFRLRLVDEKGNTYSESKVTSYKLKGNKVYVSSKITDGVRVVPMDGVEVVWEAKTNVSDEGAGNHVTPGIVLMHSDDYYTRTSVTLVMRGTEADKMPSGKDYTYK